MQENILSQPVELILPAQRSMMLVLRLTTAGVIARAGLTVDRMDDVKLAVEEACSCLIGETCPSRRLRLCFTQNEARLCIRIGLDGACGAPMGEAERTVIKCILESLVEGVELRMDADRLREVELQIALAK